jgi:hypothetical protein
MGKLQIAEDVSANALDEKPNRTPERQGDDVDMLESEDDTENESLLLVLLSSLLLLLTALVNYAVMWLIKGLKVGNELFNLLTVQRLANLKNFKRGAAKLALTDMKIAQTYSLWTQAAIKYDNAVGTLPKKIQFLPAERKKPLESTKRKRSL